MEACSPKIKGKTKWILFNNLKSNNSCQLLNLGTYSCTCMPGYRSAQNNKHGASKCEDINECNVFGSNKMCPKKRNSCENTEGSYECKCSRADLFKEISGDCTSEEIQTW